MMIRAYRPADLSAVLELFYDTVHGACARDYSAAQLDAWAPKTPDAAAWGEALRTGTTLVAEEDGRLLGFGTLRGDGYLDLLYVRGDCQGRGVGGALLDFLEFQCPAARLTVHASKTARGFFEGRGFRMVREQRAERRGQVLVNFEMEKEMD